MVHSGAAEEASMEDCSSTQGSDVCLRSRSCSGERDRQVRAARAALLSKLGPYEPVLTYLQSVLVWERPVHSVLLYIAVNVVFWFFALTSLRLLFVLASGLAVLVFADTWRNKIWPEIRVRKLEESEYESWGLVQPGVLSVPELCHHLAEAWVSASIFTSSMVQYKRKNPGNFCVLICGVFSCLAMIGYYIPGLILFYAALMASLLTPLAAYHRIFQRAYAKLEPVLQRLDFSVRGYMMSKPIDNQCELHLHPLIKSPSFTSQFLNEHVVVEPPTSSPGSLSTFTIRDCGRTSSWSLAFFLLVSLSAFATLTKLAQLFAIHPRLFNVKRSI